jgi:EpsI family protein
MSDRVSTALLVLALVLTGGFAWFLELRPPLEVDAHALRGLPPELQDWRAREVPLGETVEGILHADVNVQREYVGPQGDRVWLYVGYYGTARGGHPEHTPEVCYPAFGWRIVRQRTIPLNGTSGLRATEYLVEKDGRRDLVQVWYRSYRQTGMLGGLDMRLDHFLGHLHSGRADGALVRVSTTIQGNDEEAARSRLNAFATAFDSQLAAHWPSESAQGS